MENIPYVGTTEKHVWKKRLKATLLHVFLRILWFIYSKIWTKMTKTKKKKKNQEKIEELQDTRYAVRHLELYELVD